MTPNLVELVWKRAKHRCEYCHLPQAATTMLFEIDHIVAEQHEGPTSEENLALACFDCNRFKGPNIGGIDPLTKKPAWLFHPRKNPWKDHFRWRGSVLQGLTPKGRATIALLAMNRPLRLKQREELMRVKLFRKP